MSDPLDQLCINTIRFLSVDAMQQANSGHPGMPLGAAAMAYALWTRRLKHNPRNPHWFDRDRFELSVGHGSILLYSLLHLTGYDLSLDDLKQFRQWGSKAPGHPERGHTPGVEVTTGPLGQGLANAVGMAIGEASLAARYNRDGHTLIDHHTWAIISDGDLMEGVASEAASLAGHLKLGKLICLYDDNYVTLSAGTDITFSEDRAGRNLHFGVREHAMGAIVNGLAAHGGFIPYGATFLIFSDYMRPAIRLAALMGMHVVHVFTHDSIALGEDGPTHQPVEQLASLRAIPNLSVIRPADANETAVAWKMAVETRDRPVLLVLSRQDLPTLDRSRYASADGLRRGAYVLSEAKDRQPALILIASGSEVGLILTAAERLQNEGVAVRCVSMPSWELFDAQPQSYRDEVLPPGVSARLAVELGVSQGWYRYVGDRGGMLGIERFGASAPADVLLREYGFTVNNVVARARALLER